MQDFEDILSFESEGCVSFQEGCDRVVIRAEPLDGGNAFCIGDDAVGQVASFFTEVVLDGDEETQVVVGGVLDGEEASASGGNDTDGATTTIEWVFGVAFIKVTNNQGGTVVYLGQE